jgi:hypothetical protein
MCWWVIRGAHFCRDFGSSIEGELASNAVFAFKSA